MNPDQFGPEVGEKKKKRHLGGKNADPTCASGLIIFTHVALMKTRAVSSVIWDCVLFGIRNHTICSGVRTDIQGSLVCVCVLFFLTATF